MKKAFRTFWQIYNFLVNILGHLCIIGGLIALGYYLYISDKLYMVLFTVIGILLLIVIIAIIYASTLNKRIKANNIDSKDFKKSVSKLKESLKNKKST